LHLRKGRRLAGVEELARRDVVGRGLGFFQVTFEAAPSVVDAEDDDLPCRLAHLEQNCRASPKADSP
jgi:hypothetical protein